MSYSKIPDEKKYGQCACNGCNNALSEFDVEANYTPYCEECLKHIVFMNGTKHPSLCFCSLHEQPPIKEEMEEDAALMKKMDEGFINFQIKNKWYLEKK